MRIPNGTLIRIIDATGVRGAKAGELARYHNPSILRDDIGHSIATIGSSHSKIYRHQFEIVPGYMKFKPEQKVYLATMHPQYSRVPFIIKARVSEDIYHVHHGDIDTNAYLHELIPIHLGNKHGKYVLVKEL